MAQQFYLQSKRVADRMFLVVALDKERSMARVAGDSVTFEVPIAPAILDKLGYQIIKLENTDAK